MREIGPHTAVDAGAGGPHATETGVLDQTVSTVLAREHATEVDASYAAYDKHPADEPDKWGDLASWRRAAASCGVGG